MEKSEAKNQLCKMQGVIAERLGLDSICLCDEPQGKPKEGEVPDKVIEEMWRRISLNMTNEEEATHKSEVLEDIFNCAMAAPKIDAMSDEELAHVIEDSMLPDTPLTSPQFDVLESAMLRLKRSGGVEMPRLEEEEKQKIKKETVKKTMDMVKACGDAVRDPSAARKILPAKNASGKEMP